MKIKIYIVCILVAWVQNLVLAQDKFVLEGKIIDAENQEALIGATVVVKNTTLGVASNTQGEFRLTFSSPPPIVLVVSSIGFHTQEVPVENLDFITIKMKSENLLVNELIVSGARVDENVLESAMAIEKLDLASMKETAAPSFYDALENVKGIQLTTSSLTFKVPNARGFNIPNNFRFMQMIDGVDIQAATLGVPLGNAIGATELDILSMEITPGASSASYGMNAINGMANLQTKNPFYHQGIGFYQKTSVNHIDNKDHNAALLSETAFRFAKAYKEKIAFKLNVSYLQGTDWISNTFTDQNPNDKSSANPRFEELNELNPASDLWNRYGDERNNRTTVSISYKGKNEIFNIARTGYKEQELTSPTVRNAKADAAVFFKLSKNTELSYTYRWGMMDGIFQRGNKIRLQGVSVQNHKIELKTPNLIWRAYTSIENTGKSYNLKPLADNLDLNNGSNTAWGQRFQKKLQELVDTGVELKEAFVEARKAADEGRVEAGTEAFEQLKNTITGINNWDIAVNVPNAPQTGGAWLKQRSNLYHSDFQWNWDNESQGISISMGADYRIYEVLPDGNNFVDFSRPLEERNQPLDNGSFGKNVYYSKMGAFGQVSKKLFGEKLKLTTSVRLDYNPEFSPKFNPRIAVVYSPQKEHHIRASFQNGWRFPALFEALSFVNNGNVRRVGGLKRVNEGIGFLENSYSLTSIDNFRSAVNKDISNGLSSQEAALKNKDKLVIANLPSLQPEHINSFEVGYKSVWANNRLFLDIDFYVNIYDGFMGQVEVAVPKTGKVGTDEAVLDMLSRSKQDRYRVFTNSLNPNLSYGSSLGINYNFFKNYTINTNVNYNTIRENNKTDLFITAFNSPKWTLNASLSNKEIIKNVGFTITYRWQNAFMWESPLANGNIPAYYTLDSQVTLRVPKIHSVIKVGGSNILNRRYIQYAAGPTLGGVYYVALTFDVK